MDSHFPPKISNPPPNIPRVPGAEARQQSAQRPKSLSTPGPRPPRVSEKESADSKRVETAKRLAEASPAPAPSDEETAPPRGEIESSDSTPSPEKSPSPQITGSPQLRSGSQKKHLSVKGQASERRQSVSSEFKKKYERFWNKKPKDLAPQYKSGGESPEVTRLENPSPEPGSSPQLPASPRPPSPFVGRAKKIFRPGAPSGASPEGKKLTFAEKKQIYQDQLAREDELARAQFAEEKAKAAAEQTLGPDPTIPQQEQQPSEAKQELSVRQLKFPDEDPRKRLTDDVLKEHGPQLTHCLRRCMFTRKPGMGEEYYKESDAVIRQIARMVKGSNDAKPSTYTPIIHEMFSDKNNCWATNVLAPAKFWLPQDPAKQSGKKSVGEKSLTAHAAFIYITGIEPYFVGKAAAGATNAEKRRARAQAPLEGPKFFKDRTVEANWRKAMGGLCWKATAAINGGKTKRTDPSFLKQHFRYVPDRLMKSFNELMQAAQTAYDAAVAKRDTTKADAVVKIKANSFISTGENEIQALKNIVLVLKNVEKHMDVSNPKLRTEIDKVKDGYQALCDLLETEDGRLSEAKTIAKDAAKDPKEMVRQFSVASESAKTYIAGSEPESVSDSQAEVESEEKLEEDMWTETETETESDSDS